MLGLILCVVSTAAHRHLDGHDGHPHKPHRCGLDDLRAAAKAGNGRRKLGEDNAVNPQFNTNGRESSSFQLPTCLGEEKWGFSNECFNKARLLGYGGGARCTRARAHLGFLYVRYVPAPVPSSRVPVRHKARGATIHTFRFPIAYASPPPPPHLSPQPKGGDGFVRCGS